MELLVGGFQLLDGGLQFLVGRLELLVGRLELLGSSFQLLLGALELPVDAVVSADVGKRDAGPQRRHSLVQQGNDLDVEILDLAVRRPPFDIVRLHRPAVSVCLVDHRTEVERTVRNLEILQRPADVGGDHAEGRARPPVDRDDESPRVDHDVGDRQRVGHEFADARVAHHLAGRFHVPGLGENDEAFAERVFRDFAEDPLLEVDRSEELAPAQQHLGLTQEEVAILGERVVEARQDLGLRLRFEVHERIPGNQQIDA